MTRTCSDTEFQAGKALMSFWDWSSTGVETLVYFYSLVYPKCLAQCQPQSRYSVGIRKGFLIHTEMLAQFVLVDS